MSFVVLLRNVTLDFVHSIPVSSRCNSNQRLRYDRARAEGRYRRLCGYLVWNVACSLATAPRYEHHAHSSEHSVIRNQSDPQCLDNAMPSGMQPRRDVNLAPWSIPGWAS
jgi:hypothetical protein